MKNNNKKILLILLLFAVIGITGYGVYSYYYVDNDFFGSDEIEIVSFDPQTIINENSDFLGNGGTISLSCEDSETGIDTVSCSGSIDIENNGGTPILIEVSDATSSEEDAYMYGLDLDVNEPTFNWSSKTLEEDESATLNITVTAKANSKFVSNTPYEASQYAVNGEASRVKVSFKLKATQVHD